MLQEFLSSRRLQARIVLVYLALLVIIQSVSYWFIQDGVNTNARAAIQEELAQEENVFLRLVELNTDQLQRVAQAARSDSGWIVLPDDDRDRPIRNLLNKYASMLAGGTVLYTDLSGHTYSSEGQPRDSQVQALSQQIQLTKGLGADRRQMFVLDDKPHQMVVLPIHVDQVALGWLAVTSPIDQTLLTDMHNLAGLDVALMRRDARGDWAVLQSTQDNVHWEALASAWQNTVSVDAVNDDILQIGQDKYSAHAIALPAGAGQQPVTALLLGSLDKALAPFMPLKLKLLMLSALGIGLFAVGGYITAKRITSPLRMLTGSARRLELGDYGAEVKINSKDEVGDLAHSFEAMRQAIQMRESEIRRLAYHDALTDLPNREQFRHDLRQAILRANQDSRPCAIMLLDVDRFKHINDVLGHRFGDRLLRALAGRLRDEALEPNDILARLSGDEFGILLHDTDAQAAAVVAQRVQKALDRPITLDDHTVDLGAGIGIATCPANGLEADALLSRAEVAMYAAKTQKSGTVVYHPGLDSSSEESLTLLSELRYAVDHEQLRLYLQPKVNAATGRVIGAEALVRWVHPQRGLVPPMRFIPFAEQAGFIRVLTTWMLEESAKLSNVLRSEGMDLKLSVNLSTRDLMDQDLPVRMSELASKYSIDPSRLCLEITESAIMDDPQRALQTLERLSLQGFQLSIDDFGTGYSSLAYLKRLPVNELKIDKSFVMNMESDIQDAQIVRSTVELAHNLGLNVVAEGVESAKCWKLLSELQCDEIQGYFIARPMPSDDFVIWARQWVAPDTSSERLATAFSELI